MTARNITFVPYYGGKSQNLASTFAALFPPHKIYAELFGGGAGVLLNKKPARIEVYNDLSDGLVTLFRVVRDPEKCQELTRLLDLTPYARSEYKACQNEYLTRENWAMLGEIEQARIVYTVLQQSFGAMLGKRDGWGFGGLSKGGNVVTYYRNNIRNLPRITSRLANVQIECSDALTLLDRWAAPDTLFYLDPPYTHDSRKETRGYQHEQNNDFHETFLQKITALPDSMIFLSGYQSELYQSYLGNWHLLEFAVNAAIARDTKKQMRVECLWINPAAWERMTKAQRGGQVARTATFKPEMSKQAQLFDFDSDFEATS